MHNPRSLGENDIRKLIWEFSIPAITGMLVNALYNIVDSIFVGHGVGAIGLAAVTIAFPIMLVLMAFGMLLGVGSTTLVSIKIGERKKEEAEQILGNAFTMAVVLSLLLTICMKIFLDPILRLLGAETEVLPYARDFTNIIVFGAIFNFVAFGLNNIIRAEGSPRTAMGTLLISAFLNTILNPTFIFGLHLGIKGSALATVISQSVSALWVLLYFLSNKSYLKLRLANIRIDKNVIRNITMMGLSPFFMQLAASVVTFLYNFRLLGYGGDVAIAAFGIINRVQLLILMPIFGISQGVQPIIGYNYGAKNYSRVREALKQGIVIASAFSVVGFILVQVFDVYIIRLFNNSHELISTGSRGLRIFMAMLPVIGFQVIGSSYFQATGKSKQSLLLSLSRQVIILIPMILFLPLLLGLTGVWMAGPIADLSSALMTGLFLIRQLSKMRSTAKTGPERSQVNVMKVNGRGTKQNNHAAFVHYAGKRTAKLKAKK